MDRIIIDWWLYFQLLFQLVLKSLEMFIFTLVVPLLIWSPATPSNSSVALDLDMFVPTWPESAYQRLRRCQCIHYLGPISPAPRLNGSAVDGNAFNSPVAIAEIRHSIFLPMLPFHTVQLAQLSALERRCRQWFPFWIHLFGFLLFNNISTFNSNCRNGVSVEGATHKQVVDLIKSGGDCLTLTVISVTQQVRFFYFI